MNARWWWLGYAVTAAMMLTAMGWFTATVRSGQVAERKAERAAFADETARLALWRMDSRLATVIAREAGRPYVTYNAFYPAAGALDKKIDNSYAHINQGDVIIPSPLLGMEQEEVLLYVQYAADGSATSPQVPVGLLRKNAVPNYCTVQQVEMYSHRLANFSALVTREILDDQLKANPATLSETTINRSLFACDIAPSDHNAVSVINADRNGPSHAPTNAQQNPTQNALRVINPVATSPDQQNESSFGSRSSKEQVARFNNSNDLNSKTQQEANRQSEQQLSSIQTLNPMTSPTTKPSSISSADEHKTLSTNSNHTSGPTAADFEKIAGQAFRLPAQQTLSAEIMRPLWLRGNPAKGQASADALVLARRVRVDSTDWLQACWLDWPLIKKQLLTSIHDLLPEADVIPATQTFTQPHRLATLPFMLVPGNALPDWQEPVTSSATLPMIGAWSGVLIALIAGGVLLGGALALSERRGAFVSAVTHELRTPLTTFRLYTDLLADGQITDAKERQRCLDTLRVEADRLGHLVENVLGYAQLERNPLPAAALGIAALINGMRERLSERAGRVGLELLTLVAPDVQVLAVRGEAQAIERVLVNLVDNACKYAANAADRRLHLEVARHDNGNHISFTIRDHGPGISPDLIGKLFTPFAKSAAEAAVTAPGIGLGLALSRRLARQLNGDLTYHQPKDGGAAFTLTFPQA